MADLGKAYVQIVPSAEGISGSISKILNKESGDAGKNAGSSLGSNLVSTLRNIIVAAGIGKIVTEALNAGGALQQSFGGVETIYNEAADAVKNYASEAAKAGISANAYAEQAVSFGASLKQAFGDDITGAAEAANQAILDMADNSAKMGTDITSVQNAYQGFAKQNYTMLDNLKLGYGGTKTEMQRLLKDAQKLSGVKYNIDNLGDVYEAIHVIQGELGISGVAAQEAETTFTGSFSAMKAAVENLFANLTLGEDISTPLETLKTTVYNFLFQNLIPMLKNLITSLPTLLGGENGIVAIAVQLCQQFVDGIVSALPSILEKGHELIQSLIQGCNEKLPDILSTIISILTNILNQIAMNLPQFLMEGAQLILSMILGLMQALPQIVASISQILANLISTIVMHLPEFLQQGIEMIGQLISGIWQMEANVITTLINLTKEMWDAFTNTDWVELGKNILEGIGDGIKGAITNLVNSAKEACSKVVNGVKSFFGIASPSKLMAKEVGKFLPEGIAVGIEDNMDSANKAMAKMNSTLTGQVSSSFTSNGNLASAGGYVQNITINSPQQLSASEVARLTRNQTRQLVLNMRGM